jgi:hypothetical protein
MLVLRRSLIVPLVVLGACERGRSPANDTLAANQPATADTSGALSPTRNWDRGAGPILLVAAETPSRAIVIAPDSLTAPSSLGSLPRPASVTLLGRGGTVQTAELPAVNDAGECIVATLKAAPPPRPWSVGFLGGVVSPIAMDSAASLAKPDSLEAVVAVTRLASAMPNDSAGRFAGLPFVVRALWRFTIPDGPQVIAAVLLRQINQEATPLQEHTLLLGERAPNDTDFANAYAERSSGDEETIESREILAAVLVGTSRTPALVVGHDFGNATSYALLERDDKGKWSVRWISSRRHC